MTVVAFVRVYAAVATLNPAMFSLHLPIKARSEFGQEIRYQRPFGSDVTDWTELYPAPLKMGIKGREQEMEGEGNEVLVTGMTSSFATIHCRCMQTSAPLRR